MRRCRASSHAALTTDRLCSLAVVAFEPSSDVVAVLYLVLVLPSVPLTMVALRRARRAKAVSTVDVQQRISSARVAVPAFSRGSAAGVATAVMRHRDRPSCKRVGKQHGGS